MRRPLLVLTVLAACVASVPVASADAGATGVVVVDTSVSPETPAPGENVTVNVRVTNPADDGGGFYVDHVELRNGTADNSTLHTDRETTEATADGDAKVYNLSMEVADSGETTGVVHLDIDTYDGESYELTRNVTVRAAPDPSLSLSTEPVGPENETDVTVAVANGRSESVRSVAVALTPEGDGLSLADDRRVAPTIPAGNETTFTFPADEVEPGQRTLTAELGYVTAEGDYRTVTREFTPEIERAAASHPDLSLSAAPVSVANRTDLSLTVSNGLDDSVRAATLTLHDEDAALRLDDDRRVASRLPAGNETTFTFPASEVEPGRQTLTAELTYVTADGENRTVTRRLSTTAERVSNPAELRLTGVQLSEAGDGIVVRGSASNVGGSNVTGAVVSVAPGESVRPAASKSEFFVGSVPASDFSSFEVRATPTQNGTVTIPLRVSYVVDETRVTRTTTVSYEQEETASSTEGSGGAPVLLLGGGAVVLVGAAVGLRRWR
ncbi:hypothetical protein [Haloarcula litorea]|uniref:hypothetical protein n=1 Tax=Haloarcula litorea TaxID=3032579 RepID=UPI0023E87FEE|nr:hypothetical protein [Halomicroarcula sp. GDY20]